MSLKKFQVSAPGKIILHGEHSVVYNKPSIAGPIGLRTYFNLEETSNDVITFQYERLNLTATLKTSKATSLINNLESLEPTEFTSKIRESKDFILKYLNFGDGKDERKLVYKEEMAVCSTLYIFHRIFRAENIKSIEKGFIVKIDSDMSIGAGVGSSASYGVCLAGGFFILSQIINNKFLENFSFSDHSEILEKISKWAFDSEVIMHDKPSGIDNTICTYGQLIRFVRGQTPELINMNGMNGIDILLVDTGVSRSTSHIVAKVANLKNKYSNLVNSIYDAIGYLVDDVVTILRSSRSDKFQELSLLVSINNNLLRSLDVSHPRLEKVFQIAESNGFHSKLTGAGGGGCCFVLLPPNYQEMEKYSKMCSELKNDNYQIMATHIIDGSGVVFKSL